jgi:hypothetical protein
MVFVGVLMSAIHQMLLEFFVEEGTLSSLAEAAGAHRAHGDSWIGY